MTRPQDHLPFRTLFSEQAAHDRRHAPSFDATLRRPRTQPRLSLARLALAAGLLLAAGAGIPLTYHSLHQGHAAPPQAALPNLLDALDPAPLAQWPSPTAFLLDFTAAQTERLPSPGPAQFGPESRNSNG